MAKDCYVELHPELSSVRYEGSNVCRVVAAVKNAPLHNEDLRLKISALHCVLDDYFKAKLPEHSTVVCITAPNFNAPPAWNRADLVADFFGKPGPFVARYLATKTSQNSPEIAQRVAHEGFRFCLGFYPWKDPDVMGYRFNSARFDEVTESMLDRILPPIEGLLVQSDIVYLKEYLLDKFGVSSILTDLAVFEFSYHDYRAHAQWGNPRICRQVVALCHSVFDLCGDGSAVVANVQ